jgi:hypothetical protein
VRLGLDQERAFVNDEELLLNAEREVHSHCASGCAETWRRRL